MRHIKQHVKAVLLPVQLSDEKWRSMKMRSHQPAGIWNIQCESGLGYTSKTEHTVAVGDGAGDRLPHAQKRISQEALYRAPYVLEYAELRHEHVDGPEARAADEQRGLIGENSTEN
jgi:hypothetical protein